MSSIKDEGYDMDESISYTNFSGDYAKFDQLKEDTRKMFRHTGILKYLTKEVKIPTEYESGNDEYEKYL